MFATPNQVSILSVSKLNRFAKRVLESEIGLVWVTGEISNFVAAASGHWYFTLKDSQAQVKSAMFKGANQRASFRPKAGDKVVVRANISLYEPRGDYQLIVQHIEPEGLGQLKQAFEALKAQLQQEGLFEQARKKPIPEHVNKIGVVTSPTGAAIHDILHVLARRNPAIEVILYPSIVQGESAGASIAAQIQLANARNEVDVLIVGRGGGSLEDLWPFNEEILARAVYASHLPIVSAVGHEVDVTICDFVADMRAPTPSAAAETLSKDSEALKRNITLLKQRLLQSVKQLGRHNAQRLDIALANFNRVNPQRSLSQHQHALLNLSRRLKLSHPEHRITQAKSQLSQLNERLNKALTSEIKEKTLAFATIDKRFQRIDISTSLIAKQSTLDEKLKQLNKYQQALIDKYAEQLASKADLLNSVSPLATLSRGYSITYQNGEIVRDADMLKANDIITTKFHQGEVRSKVISRQ
uniref:exodeoxyribonuclease VII large subunit n=1 Tax=Ningiella ruwaisensis TaxID=2364274 RepID=UPI00109F9CB6|nr:exodeoxyribonuclease VII large subunit [Ningiella ruwaisensis]